MTVEEVKVILELHKKWVQSGGSFGKQANFSKVCAGSTFWTNDNRQVIFSKGSIDKIDLYEADLTEAIFEGLTIREANLVGTILNKANMRQVDFTGSDLSKAKLQGANLEESDLSAAIFLDVDIRESNLHEAKLGNVNLQSSDIQAAIFKKAQLQGANFESKSFTKADFSEADLTGAIFDKCKIDDVKFRGAILTNAKFRDSIQRNTDFSDATLIGTDFENSNLYRVIFSGSKLTKTNFEQAKFTGADFKLATLIETNFLGANLPGVLFQGAYLLKTIFVNANLQYANFENLIITRIESKRNEKGIPEDHETVEVMATNLQENIWKNCDLSAIIIPESLLASIPQKYIEKFKHTFRYQSKDTIIRSIEFPPEYHEAGINILSYFATVLQQKYNNIKSKVKIEQQGLKVRMIIETEEGFRDMIEKTLDNYGLVITGKMKMEEFFNDPVQVIELKQQLRIAQIQIESKKELLDYANKNTNSLQDQINNLVGIVSQAIKSQSFSIKTNLHVNQTQNNSQEEVKMIDKSKYIKFGDNANIGGNLVFSEKMTNCLNQVESSNIPNELKSLLKALATEIEQLIENLPSVKSDQIANDFQILTTEATSRKPRKKWWRSSIESIKEVATFAGDIGKTTLLIIEKMKPFF